jgi:cellobiose phosphorylase
MTAVQQRLVRAADRLILLLDPPFDKGTLEPGYIKGYVPGIRENGGQYTHASTWASGPRTPKQASGQWTLRAGEPDPPRRYSREGGPLQGRPYVVAADVYGAPPHMVEADGPGTGSAGWLYRVGLEAILGFHLQGSLLKIEPCIPPDWPGYEITYRHGSTSYHVTVDNRNETGRGVCRLILDGQSVEAGAIDLVDDGKRHEVLLMTAVRENSLGRH